MYKNENIKICVLGASFETGNMGVSALTEGSIKCILNRWPDAKITLLGSGYEPHQQRLLLAGKEICVRTLPVRFSKNVFLPYHFLWFALYGLLSKVLPWWWAKKRLFGLNRHIRTLHEADLVVDITAGDSFSDIYGMRRFIIGFLCKWLVKVFRKKLVLLPQTYGPYRKRVTKALARQVLSYATVVYSRDRSGVDYVKRFLNSRNENGKIRFLPDVGFVLDSRRPESTNIDSLEKIKAENKVLVGLNVSGLLNRSSSVGDNKFDLQVDYIALVNSVVELLMKYNGTAVILVPHVFPPPELESVSDVVACRKIYEQTAHKYDNRIFLARGHYNHNEIKYIIGLCDFFIGSRMHSCIAALSQSIPAVGLAYSKKFRGVFESVGVEELVIDMRRHGQDEVLTAIDNAFENREAVTERLRRTIPDVQARILNMFRDFELYMQESDKVGVSRSKKTGHRRTSTSVQAVVDRKICCGCGACSVICPTSCVEFVYGHRYNYPKIDAKQCVQCGKCLEVCPSAFLLKGNDPGYPCLTEQKDLNCYLAHSPDDDVRLDASSGGFITGLILHLMKNGQADGAIVARCQGKDPFIAESFIATTREQLLSARASKYAPVSNCAVLAQVLERSGRYVFVGTPCMIEGLTKLQEQLPKLKERIAFSIALVCSGMASRLSTKRYLERYGVNIHDVRRICYRGNGWPGNFRAYGDNGLILDRPYKDELDHLISCDHYLRCWNCLDHWARCADVVVCDPWCEEIVRVERKGWSAVMVRTERGREAVASAIDSGDMMAKSITVADMLGYNKHLVIHSDHPRHGWMAGYQLIFFGRLKYLVPVLGSLIRRKRIGLRTTLKARLSKEYYY